MLQLPWLQTTRHALGLLGTWECLHKTSREMLYWLQLFR